MSRHSALMAVKDAIGGGESFWGKVDIIVENSGKAHVYHDVSVRVSYNIGYMQMDVDILWDDDDKEVNYRKLGLHAGYNSNFQDFSFENNYLQWSDGKNHISIRFS